jgi:hypothetical protein
MLGSEPGAALSLNWTSDVPDINARSGPGCLSYWDAVMPYPHPPQLQCHDLIDWGAVPDVREVLSFRLSDFPIQDHVDLIEQPARPCAVLRDMLAGNGEARAIRAGINGRTK